jgi:hypothetical protein
LADAQGRQVYATIFLGKMVAYTEKPKIKRLTANFATDDMVILAVDRLSRDFYGGGARYAWRCA